MSPSKKTGTIRQRRRSMYHTGNMHRFLPLSNQIPPRAYVWNVSAIPGPMNYSEVSEIPDLYYGDIIRIWGVCNHTYEGGFTIDSADVVVREWEGSLVRPCITNTTHTAPAVTVTADNVTLQGAQYLREHLFG